tara:strand:- start:4709 stop:4963 length:255 start_codon:yes stop_codon:yes gene_type:complete
MPNSGNETWMHYLIITKDKDDNEINRKYYLTLFDIMDEYKVSRGTLGHLLSGRVKKSRKLGNIDISRVREPVHILVDNPLIDQY